MSTRLPDRSERLLMRHAADRLSVRWFMGYDLNESLPDHSSLTHIRTRYGVEVFRCFFEKVRKKTARLLYVLCFSDTLLDGSIDLHTLCCFYVDPFVSPL
jgi:Transposase domain (DUF772)